MSIIKNPLPDATLLNQLLQQHTEFDQHELRVLTRLDDPIHLTMPFEQVFRVFSENIHKFTYAQMIQALYRRNPMYIEALALVVDTCITVETQALNSSLLGVPQLATLAEAQMAGMSFINQANLPMNSIKFQSTIQPQHVSPAHVTPPHAVTYDLSKPQFQHWIGLKYRHRRIGIGA